MRHDGCWYSNSLCETDGNVYMEYVMIHDDNEAKKTQVTICNADTNTIISRNSEFTHLIILIFGISINIPACCRFFLREMYVYRGNYILILHTMTWALQ